MRTLAAGDLVLEPQTAAHAPEMFTLLRDPALYLYLDNDPPPDEAWLAARFTKLETRLSGDGNEQWLNWVIRSPRHGLVGFVQGTVFPDRSANIGYELGSAFWGRGWATLATRAMLQELESNYAVTRPFATVDKRNLRSISLLQRLEFSIVDPTGHPHGTVADGDWLFARDSGRNEAPMQ
jgi:[ribosomal protein S5]-alanine N-acetyltransferase